MNVSSILRLGSSTIVEVIGDPTNGFNAALIQAAADNGVNAFEIDFSRKSRNFFKSNFGILDLLENDGADLPAICLYEDGDENVNLLTSNIFSGTLRWRIDVHLSWSNNDMAQDLDGLRYAVHDALVNVVNSEAAMEIWQTTTGLAFNGGVGLGGLGPLHWSPDQNLWIQTMPFWIRMVANVN